MCFRPSTPALGRMPGKKPVCCQYGRLYCQEIDLALARGFDPQAVLEVRKTLTNDLEPCVFVFHQARQPGEADFPSQDATMPWDYHCAHLYQTTREVFGETIGRKRAAPVTRSPR